MVKKELTDCWPFSGWPPVKAILERLVVDEKSVDKRTLPSEVGLSLSSINGAIPAMKAMGLVEPNGHRTFLKLTEMGRTLARAVRSDDREIIHNIGLEALSKYPRLETASRVLNTHPGISSVELARLVASEHGKQWPKEKTYSHVGSAMKSLLIGFSLVEKIKRRRNQAHKRFAQVDVLELRRPPKVEPPFLPIIHELIVALHRFHVYDTRRLLDNAQAHDDLKEIIARLEEDSERESLRIRIDHIKHFIDRAFETKDVTYLKDAGWIADDIVRRICGVEKGN